MRKMRNDWKRMKGEQKLEQVDEDQLVGGYGIESVHDERREDERENRRWNWISHSYQNQDGDRDRCCSSWQPKRKIKVKKGNSKADQQIAFATSFIMTFTLQSPAPI